jgi:hypothetical protein
MQIVLRISYLLISPVLMLVYWRNSMKTIDNLHANYELRYADL